MLKNERKMFMKEDIKAIVSQNIKRYRKKAHITQAQLAEQIGKTVEMVCQLENNVASTKLSTLEAIANVFDLEPYQLLLPREYPDYERFSPELTDLMLELQDQPKEVLEAFKILLQYHKAR